MEILVSFMLTMVFILIVVFGTLAVQESHKAYRKHKNKNNIVQPQSVKEVGNQIMHVELLSGGSFEYTEENVKKDTSPFKDKHVRRFYRWFYTKVSPHFTIMAKSSVVGRQYLTVNRDDIKSIAFFWKPMNDSK